MSRRCNSRLHAWAVGWGWPRLWWCSSGRRPLHSSASSRASTRQWPTTAPVAEPAVALDSNAGPRRSSCLPVPCAPVTRCRRQSRSSRNGVPARSDRRFAPSSPTTGSPATSSARSSGSAPASRIPPRIVLSRPWPSRTASVAASSARCCEPSAASSARTSRFARRSSPRQSWTLVAARVAAAAPWLVLLLVASRPQGAQAYDSLSGFVVLVGGAVATMVGYRLMVALGRLPEEPRVLVGSAPAVGPR